jgi:hypothetical protein
VPLEVLNLPLVLLCALARVERAEVPAPVRPPIRFAGIEPVPAVVEFPDHIVATERPRHKVMHKLIVLLFFITLPFLFSRFYSPAGALRRQVTGSFLWAPGVSNRVFPSLLRGNTLIRLVRIDAEPRRTYATGSACKLLPRPKCSGARCTLP